MYSGHSSCQADMYIYVGMKKQLLCIPCTHRESQYACMYMKVDLTHVGNKVNSARISTYCFAHGGNHF